jgi:excisionase family DNA binding protein
MLSPRNVAAAIGVSESSLKRWVDDGLLRAARTAGGHRRIAVQEAVRFVRARRVPLARPDLLVRGAASAGRGGVLDGEQLFTLLVQDRRAEVVSALIGRFLAGDSLADLCDGPMRSALARIGELWRHEERGLLVEHRATDTILQALTLLRHLLQGPSSAAPVALGGAPSGDRYFLPSLMAAAVLADVGYRDANLGADVPADTFVRAIDEYQPALVWLSVTAAVEAGTVRQLLRALVERGRSRAVPIVGGGRSLDRAVTAEVGTVHHLGSMAELAGFARAHLSRWPHAESTITIRD